MINRLGIAVLVAGALAVFGLRLAEWWEERYARTTKVHHA